MIVPALGGALARAGRRARAAGGLLGGSRPGRRAGSWGALLPLAGGRGRGCGRWPSPGRRRRLALAQRPFSTQSRQWLRDHVRTYAAPTPRASGGSSATWRGSWTALTFEGAGGAEATPRLRLAVAAGAAVLLHGHPDWEIPTERTVLLVPDTFDEAYGDEEPGVYDGMVHSQGPIVLSARAVEQRLGARRRPQRGARTNSRTCSTSTATRRPTACRRFSTRVGRRLARAGQTEMRRAAARRRHPAARTPPRRRRVLRGRDGAVFRAAGALGAHHPELFDALAAFYNRARPTSRRQNPVKA